ncbi:MAG: hypothetical protein ABSB82_12335 [Terriglobia bacterium]|jgi:hypothetical protein
MTQDDSKLLGALTLGFMAGIYFFFKGFRDFRKYRLIADTPEIPIRSVPMGFVEIHGKAQGEKTVPSPVSHTQCFTYQVVIERWKTDSHGNGSWAHERTDVDGVDFYLADATGKVLVSPRQAEFDLPQNAQRVARSGGSASTGPGATNEELLQYVTQANVHMFTGLAERGLKAVGPLGDPALEQKRQGFMGLLQHMPGSPDFQRQMITMMAPAMKQRLEAMGSQSDPKHEQARQTALGAFQHPVGSPEFMEVVNRAIAESGSPAGANKFMAMMQGGPAAAASMFGAASGRYRLTEYCIVPEGSYEVSGTCVENPNPRDEHDRNMITKGQNEPTFLISSRTEKALKSMLGRKAALHIFGGAALSVVCLAIILAKLGWLWP